MLNNRRERIIKIVKEISNVCLLLAIIFALMCITRISKAFPDLDNIIPKCIVVFLVIGAFGRLASDVQELGDGLRS